MNLREAWHYYVIRHLNVGLVWTAGKYAAAVLAGVMISGGGSGLFGVVTNRLEFPMVDSEIEMVRLEARGIPCDGRAVAFSSIVAAANDFNQRIAHERTALGILYARPFVSGRWNQVEPIELPCEGK